MMTDALDDTTQATTPEPGPATAGKAPAGTPSPEAGQQGDDAELDVLDLDGDDGEEGGDAGESRASEATDADASADRPAWQRPEGLDGVDLLEWKERQGLPADASGYEVDLKFGEGQTITETGQQLIDGLKGFAVENDLPPPAVNGLVNWYNKQVEAQQTKLAEADKTLRKATRDTLTQRWAGVYDQRVQVAKEGARFLPQGLREALKVARTPDGRRVSDTPEFAEALLAIGRLTQKGKPVPTSDEERLAEVQNVMRTDIDRYEREGLSKEALDLGRRIAAKGQTHTPGTLTAAEAQEEAELVQMMQTNIDAYAHRPYRGSGRPAADRLLELRRKRAGEAA